MLRPRRRPASMPISASRWVSNTALSVNLTREVTRIDSLLGSNSIADQRMSSSQTALGDMSSQAQKLMDQLVALRGNTDGSSVSLTQQTASATLSSFVSDANTMVNGEYLFAGTNTDVQPINDNTANATATIKAALTQYASDNGSDRRPTHRRPDEGFHHHHGRADVHFGHRFSA